MMLKLAVGIEEATHKDGWGQPAGLYTIFRQPTPDLEADMFVVEPFIAQPSLLSDNPVQALLFIAGIMRTENPPPIIPPELVKDFAGVAFVAEGFYNNNKDELGTGRSLADLPGSMNVRHVHMIDCAGRYFFVYRARNTEPVFQVIDPHPTADDITASGNIPIGLRDMMLAIGQQVPFATMDLDAVRSIAREGIEDL